MNNTKLPQMSKAEAEARKEISDFLKKALGKNYDESALTIGYPPSGEFGDFCVSFFILAKKIGQKPEQLARDVAEIFQTEYSILKDHRVTFRAKNFGPYLNFFIDTKNFAHVLLEEIMSEDEDYGSSTIGNNGKIMIEYSQPNTHKEFHIGHLRNVCIGSSLVNLYHALGYAVIAANYIGDIGMHVAKCLWAFTKFHATEKLPENKGKYFGVMYVEGTRFSEEDEKNKLEVSEVLQKLEAGDRKLKSLWRKTRKWCLDEFKAIYKRLGVEFDVYFFESEVEKDGKKMVEKLLNDGIAQKSQGAVIIDLEKFGLKQFLVLKSDGTSLYSTKDLALAVKKFKKYKIDKSFYVTDTRQSFYFQQLFKALEIIGFRKDVAHIPYELVSLEEGAMSSRSGNIVLYEDVEAHALKRASEETKKRHQDWSENDVLSASKSIAYAAMKYSMLSHSNGSRIVFNLNRALEITGNTGPYLQYVHARISSLLKKAGGEQHPTELVFETEEEKGLLKKLSYFPSIILVAAEKFEPSLVANYLHELAQFFSVFYEKVPVLKAEDDKRKSRILLAFAVQKVIARGLKILGIDAPEKM